MKNRISVKETAKLLSVSEPYIRNGLRKGTLPFGTAVKMSSVWTYHISPVKLQHYIGEHTHS